MESMISFPSTVFGKSETSLYSISGLVPGKYRVTLEGRLTTTCNKLMEGKFERMRFKWMVSKPPVFSEGGGLTITKDSPSQVNMISLGNPKSKEGVKLSLPIRIVIEFVVVGNASTLSLGVERLGTRTLSITANNRTVKTPSYKYSKPVVLTDPVIEVKRL